VDVASNVVITGTGFQSGATVTFDRVPGKTTVLTSTTITMQAPARSEGAVDIIVSNPGGQSVTLIHGYTYARMAVTSVLPGAGIIGKWVRVRGFGFAPDVAVSFGDIRADVVFFESNVSLFAVTPVRPAGPVDVVATNPDGPSATLEHGFTYQTVTVTVSQSAVAAGAELTVNWSAPAGQSDADWIGLFKVGDPNTKVIWFDYTNGVATGSRNVRVPSQPGEYEFRYLVDDSYNDAARSETVRVVGGH